MVRLAKWLLLLSLPLVVAAVAGCGAGSLVSHDPPESPLTHCPTWPPGVSGGDSPGAEGETVTDEPVSALVCRWRGNERNQTERHESVVRGRALTDLVAALNSLPPGEEGEFACPSGTPLDYLVGLLFSDTAGLLVEAEFHSCDTARTKDHWWGASEELRGALDAALAE